MFKKVLIANRGEIAVRIIKTLRRLGIASVAVYSDADRFALHVRQADEAIRLGPAHASESYLNVEAVIAACKETGAEAVHPGYGFLSENIGFAERLQAEGIAFIGPTPENIASFGLKHTARQLAADSGVPLLPGSGLLDSAEDALSQAELIGYPVMLKSTAGGGGIGMQLCHDATSLQAAFDTVQRTAKASFGDARVYLERFVSKARHVEVQIFGDGQGRVIALGERDCSLQRRNQKVIEETPAPGLSDAVRQRLHAAAVSLGRSVHYRSAGTVEFIYDPARKEFYFLEVNTRLQVEHPVTEAVFGIDLVEWMIRQAADEDVLTGNEHLVPKGAAIEARIYAEMPHADFRPSAGLLTDVVFPKTARVDGWIETGTEVTPYYDPMLAKLIVTAKDRETAITALQSALSETSISGIETNLDYLAAIAASDLFLSGHVATTALKDFSFVPDVVEVIAPGAQSSLQELPGRLGLWHVGVPPSGPMDARSFRHANRLVGNGDEVAALELTVSGPVMKFFSDVTVALAGAEMAMTLDGTPVAHNTAFTVKPGQVLAIGRISGPGQRAYLAVSGGFAAPVVLGSRATFGLGQFGGNATGTLKAGHVLRLARSPQPVTTPADEPPELTRAWSVGVVYGPHGAPDFFLDSDIETLFSTDYEVHFNSARTGVRLIGPAPTWARQDGGEAGLHPSNLHDNPYAIGAIDFTGDMPIILGPDGPSLGGFVCPAVIAGDEQWKMGQFKPGDTIRFHPVGRDGDSAAALGSVEHGIPPSALPGISPSRGEIGDGTAEISRSVSSKKMFSVLPISPLEGEMSGRTEGGKPPIPTAAETRLPPEAGSPILSHNSNGPVSVTYRRQGDDNLLVEYGEMQLDIAIRMRVHLLMQAVKAAKLPSLIDLTPGIRSLQIHYDGTSLSRTRLLGLLSEIEASLPPAGDVTVPSRTVYLPLSWNDPEAELAMRKYQELVRPNAPWCPSNIEFIRRINGLADEQAVKDTIFNARYLVMGLGDVYLGAPVATPLDPRHRLVTTKYNPARTWTPENAVGIGGAYMCIYGMEGPGGYQLFGRTIQMWNTWRQTPVFTRDKPWLLDFFDQIRFFPVSHDELMEARAAFPHGGYPIRIEDGAFSYANYAAELAENAESIGTFKRQQQAAFEAERQRWKDQGLDSFTADEDASPGPGGDIPDNCFGVESAVPGNLWKLLVEEGQSVAAGETIAIIESMKMEITVTAHAPGILRELRAIPGKTVKAGDVIAVLQNL
ncbi:5-oxoprolinase/urea amidolyase family protein [Agrobacterium vitis]|uniref:5-oxoprolinase/urea amidolyase family protein n=1 Tax=Rhizobium/Agrobacterium group TaxID=227290 RepID=UPI0012E8858A|nr:MULTISPECIES: 5-oxoprolinase/urea amidolyase family protein [Rhizobium/Agrobacterium group]MCF1492846.1 5-oxoprolinase/urea amidolyase family protein [Allorhizobium ampelinum]MVA45643.1 5-oxoprolinase/urea amidolyase family protein [Agrobacterium vitis]